MLCQYIATISLNKKQALEQGFQARSPRGTSGPPDVFADTAFFSKANLTNKLRPEEH